MLKTDFGLIITSIITVSFANNCWEYLEVTKTVMAANQKKTRVGKRIVFWGIILCWSLLLVTEVGAFLSSQSGWQIESMSLLNLKNRRNKDAPWAKTSQQIREQNKEIFFKRYGQDWKVFWDPVTYVPHLASRKNTSASDGLWRSLFWTEEELIKYAEGFVEENRDLFCLGDSSFKLVRVTKKAGIWFIDFQQIYQQIPVYGTKIKLRFDGKYRLLSFGVDVCPRISMEVSPFIDENKACQIVAEDLGLTDQEIENKAGYKTELIIFPFYFGSDEGMESFLAWLVEKDQWRYFVEAEAGHILARYNRNRQAVSGQMQGMILPRYSHDTPVKVPLVNQKIYLLNKEEPVYKESMDSDPDWKAEGLWEYGQPIPDNLSNPGDIGHGGPPDPSAGHTGDYVYGYNLNGDYTDLMSPRYLTSQSIDCAGKSKLVLRFWRWLGVDQEYEEDELGVRYYHDRALVSISNDSGTIWSNLWANGLGGVEDGKFNSSEGTWYGWSLQAFDISRYADNNSILLRWGMGPTDSGGVFCGWNIDDVEILESINTYTDPNGDFIFPLQWAKNTVSAKLEGKYVKVYNSQNLDILYSQEDIPSDYTAEHIFDPNDNGPEAGYDEVNVYYHINRMLQYIKEIDPNYYEMDKLGPITAFTRWGKNFNNSFFSPYHCLYFGQGDNLVDGFRNLALFSDVIYHEYAHAITESIYAASNTVATRFIVTPTTSSNTQTGVVFPTELDALDEAFSDYWAATLNNDPLIGEGDLWLGHPYIRTLENACRYPDDYGNDAYDNSLIISGAMWQVRKEFSQDIADRLFHLARYNTDLTFVDFLNSVLMWDDELYEGQHKARITEIFGLRGISQPPLPPTRVIGVAGNTIIQLTWAPHPDDPSVVGYKVYFRTENEIESSREDPSEKRNVNNNTYYTLEGLTNDTTYVLKITAYDIYGTESEFSDYVYATPYKSKTSNYKLSSGETGHSLDFCFIRACCGL